LNIIDFKYAIKIGYEAFAGISVQNIDDLAVSCFLSEIKDNIFQDGLKEIQELKKKDYKILLATGAHMSIALIFSKYIEADYCVATKSIVINDHYTRKGIQPLPYKEGKRDLVLQKINEIFGDEERIITVYTDEKKDLPLLSAANIYVAVNADKQILDFIHLKGGESKIFK
ncbi:MAG: haloacid dehalogenase-like hydrolase, partial [Rhodobacterales bacterium]|nr:haloacid dehalogenase-like hydrolase [Rhodobacterales bacterium]